MKIINVVGTRPNFMKIAPIIREMNKSDKIEHILVHTGQHYDTKMSQNFFDELEIPKYWDGKTAERFIAFLESIEI